MTIRDRPKQAAPQADRPVSLQQLVGSLRDNRGTGVVHIDTICPIVHIKSGVTDTANLRALMESSCSEVAWNP